MWSHLPIGSPDWLRPPGQFARSAMWRYASSHSYPPSAAAWPSNSPRSATADEGHEHESRPIAKRAIRAGYELGKSFGLPSQSGQQEGPVSEAFEVAGAEFEQTSGTAYRLVEVRRLQER
jgi:hypothetical protein